MKENQSNRIILSIELTVRISQVMKKNKLFCDDVIKRIGWVGSIDFWAQRKMDEQPQPQNTTRIIYAVILF